MLLVALSGLAAAPVVDAAGLADSPWPMFQHDPRHTGRSPYLAPSQLERKWRFRVEGQPSSPAIGADGTIYLPTGSAVLPADAGGFLYAINPNGTQRWRYQFPNSSNCVTVPDITTPAVADDGTVYVHTQSGRTLDGSGNCTAGPSFLFAINSDGSLKWRYQLNSGAAVFVGKGISSPAVGADGRIFLTSRDTGLYAINPNGTLSWVRSPAATSIGSSPALGADGTIYVNVFDLYAYEPDGDPLWTAEVGDGCCIESSPAIAAEGTVYVCSLNPDKCHAVSPTGNLSWSVPLRVGRATSPALGGDGAIYITSSEGGDTALNALNPNGTQRWRNLFSFGRSEGIDHSPVIGGDGRLYVRHDTELGPTGGLVGRLFAVNADGSAGDRVTIPHATGQGGELNPAIGSDGTLYVPEPRVEFSYDPNDQHLAAYVQDTAAPETTISSGPSGTTPDATPTFAFSSSEPFDSTFACRVDGAAFGPCSGPGASHTTAPLSDGPHTFEVRATDGASNTDPTPASRSFTVATQTAVTPPPDATISPSLGTTPGPLAFEDTSVEDTSVELEVTARRTQRALRQRGIVLFVECPAESCRARAGGFVSVPDLRNAAASRRFRLRAVHRSLARGERARLELRFSARLRRQIRRAVRNRRARQGIRGRVSVTVTDAADNTNTKRLAVRLRR